MRICVCVKQVPGTSHVEVDPETGVLKRGGVEAKLNPYDLYAIETAVRLKADIEGSRVIAVTMGPPQAEEAIRETFMMGADEGWLVTDRRFAGSDVYATSRALSQALLKIGMPDLVICGKQTTDGDTAQVGSEVAELLGIPHVTGVGKIERISFGSIVVRYELTETVELAEVCLPCLITVDKGIHQPRLPSYLLGKKSADKEVKRLGLEDFFDRNPLHYGLDGSPTQVKRIFPPEHDVRHEVWEGPADETAEKLFRLIEGNKFLEGIRR